MEKFWHEGRISVGIIRCVENDGTSISHREVMTVMPALDAIAFSKDDVGSRHEHRTESGPQALWQRARPREAKQMVRGMRARSLDEVIDR